MKTQPHRKLSFWRVMIALLLLGSIGYGAYQRAQSWQEERFIPETKAWFAPYVDVTSTPTYAFEQVSTTGTSQLILAFIVASQQEPCTPTWGTYYTMEEANTTLDLDRRIARLRQQNGNIAISFGGALNSELSLACTDHDKLLAAYEAVIDRYNIDTIDLDLENTSLSDSEAQKRRATVIAELQSKRRASGKHLAVWLTLPVAPQGLTEAGTTAISTMLAEKVDLAGINLMTMDYGGSKDANLSMFEASKNALVSTHRQLGILYKQAGITLSSATLWKKIGATPMIGQNDVPAEIFTTDDAQALNDFLQEVKVSRVSMWSANRDTPCGENYVDTKVVSDSCSGVKSEKYSYTKILKTNFDGDMSANAVSTTVEEPQKADEIVDDPKSSPYQIWNEKGAYLAGVKVVWRGNVYEAKWWSRGDLPDNPVLQAWQTPWQLIGPVLPGEKLVSQPTLPPGIYPTWSGTIEYQTGQRVLFEGTGFEAKWWNQGQSPAAAAANSDSSPWTPLSKQDIQEAISTYKPTAQPRTSSSSATR
jgi:chitinase